MKTYDLFTYVSNGLKRCFFDGLGALRVGDIVQQCRYEVWPLIARDLCTADVRHTLCMG